MEKLSTKKFHNFSRSTTFILIVSPFEVIWKIYISNLRNSNVVFLDKMISNKKLSTIKFYNFSTSTTFILAFGHLFIWHSGSNIVHKITYLWNYKRDVNFMNNVTTTSSDEEMTKIKVVDLDEFYNFYAHDFFSWNHLIFQNDVWSCHFLKFK